MIAAVAAAFGIRRDAATLIAGAAKRKILDVPGADAAARTRLLAKSKRTTGG